MSDGIAATSATLYVEYIFGDQLGNVYFTDSGNPLILNRS